MVHARAQAAPMLQTGQRMDAAEFERRWNALPQLKFAELIDGEVFVPSPTSAPHGRGSFLMLFWLGTYEASTPGVRVIDSPTVRLDGQNRPQPDAMLMIEAVYGGQAFVSADGYITRSPELIVEVAISTVQRDLELKRRIYGQAGAKEYLVWLAEGGRLAAMVAEDGNLVEVAPDEDGIWRSRAFPGLWLNIAALQSDDLSGLLTTLQMGLVSPEHAAFVQRLADARAQHTDTGA